MNLTKKILSVLMVAVLLFTVAPVSGLEMKASAASEGYYTYTVTDETATITDVDTAISGDVIIPDTLGGYSVTSIGNYAFWNCTSLESITIPDSVTSIGNSAFRDCSSLENVAIGNSVTSIGNSAFRDCSSLENVAIGNSVTSIGNYAFKGCTSLENVYITDMAAWCNITCEDYDSSSPLLYARNLYLNGELVTNLVIPDGVTSISDYAFWNCTSLTSITIPDSVTSIGNSAFRGCSSLENVAIGNSVTSIGNYAFWNCTSLESITIPDSVTSIGYSAFGTSLTSITVDENNEYYSSDEYGVLFNKDRTELIQYPIGNTRTSYTIPDGVTIMGGETFWGCEYLTNVTIGDGLTYLGFGTFLNCKNLERVTIGRSVTGIGGEVFYRCSSLKEIEIPDSVTFIEYMAFEYCESLEKIIISDSVTWIGTGAFRNCDSLVCAHYCGTQEQWDEVVVQDDNEVLTDIIHMNIDKNNNDLCDICYGEEIEPEETTTEPTTTEPEETTTVPSTEPTTTELTTEEPTTAEIPDDPSEDCSCMCHKDGFVGFIWDIISFFIKIFKAKPVCDCGVAHY